MLAFENTGSRKLEGSTRVSMQNALGISKCFGLGHFSAVFDFFTWWTGSQRISRNHPSMFLFWRWCCIAVHLGGCFFFIWQRQFFESSVWGFMHSCLIYVVFPSADGVRRVDFAQFFPLFGFVWLSVLLQAEMPAVLRLWPSVLPLSLFLSLCSLLFATLENSVRKICQAKVVRKVF